MSTLHAEARTERLGADGRVVFASDFHMGDGGARDDYRTNAELVEGVLSSYYLDGGWRLVLNGDIEELHKSELSAIRRAHADAYDLFRSFRAGPGLTKIVGNHDLGLLLADDYDIPLEHALRLELDGGSILAFHGHQASKLFMKYNYLSDFIVRYIAQPLKIRNADIPMTSKRRFKTEKNIYRAAQELGVIVVAGHTHRPLFESFSKYDSLRWSIETLLRRYADESAEEREGTAALVDVYVSEFRRLSKKEKKARVSKSLYGSEGFLVPCMFNSGCATGRGGFTTIELTRDDIALAYWTREGAAKPYIEREALQKDDAPGTPWVRYTLGRDSLEYVLARARLLSRSSGSAD